MKTRRELCVFILWLMLAPLVAWLESATVYARCDLSNSRVVVMKEGTHGTGSPCIDGLISQFVAQGSPGAKDASCVDQIHLPPFLTQSQIDQDSGNNAAK